MRAVRTTLGQLYLLILQHRGKWVVPLGSSPCYAISAPFLIPLPSLSCPLSHPLAAFPFSATLYPLPSVLLLRVYEGSKIRDVTPGAYDSRHYCPSKLTVRYCSPPPTSLPLFNKFLSPFGLQDFRFRPQLPVSHSNTPLAVYHYTVFRARFLGHPILWSILHSSVMNMGVEAWWIVV